MWADVKQSVIERISDSGGEGYRPASVLRDNNLSIWCNAIIYYMGASQLVTVNSSPKTHHELTVTITTKIQLQLQFKELDSSCDY